MPEYRFKNLNVKYGTEEFLVNGNAVYSIEDYDEDGKEALFEKAIVLDALGRGGYVISSECLGYISEAVVESLNKDSQLCRSLGHRL